MIASPAQSAEAEMIFKAAERSDPDGWPSFWELARMPHPHVDPTADDPLTGTTVVTAWPSAHRLAPARRHRDRRRDAAGITRVWDVTTRFGTGTPPKVRQGLIAATPSRSLSGAGPRVRTTGAPDGSTRRISLLLIPSMTRAAIRMIGSHGAPSGHGEEHHGLAEIDQSTRANR